ncbi:40S ribosomal protein S23 [Galemys pyrenaicus]|uniref:Small ribosomal subunit protein uS12 n=1 Tax=Galemys pyrenaicus TaxID=202257 RepID=A0A8J5ZYC6_GALPY|nr:40S ribosomal protein S23 [Galemys pyrenaicus]KAG8510298.1 40S ribosomal protein S23 [Galemys pyrenaicus]
MCQGVAVVLPPGSSEATEEVGSRMTNLARAATQAPASELVQEKVGVEARGPNSATRKCIRVWPVKNRGKKITAFVANDGGLTFIEDKDDFWLLDLAAKVMLLVTFLESDLWLPK